MAFVPTTAFRNALATYLGTQVDALSIHSADPGSTGANEITVAARQTPAWGLGATGELTLSTQEDFTGATALATVHSVGLWLSGTFKGYITRTSGDAAVNAAGQYSVTALSVTNSAS